MSNRGYHYEQAFEDYLQRRRISYVPISQVRKAQFADVKIKSFDYIIYPNHKTPILADLKGRKFSCRAFQQNRSGPSWLPREDVEDLKKWEEIFGAGHLAMFVFAYWLHDSPHRLDHPQVHCHEERNYAFVAAELEPYLLHMKRRSPSWKTVYVPSKRFAVFARPFGSFIRR